MRSYCAKTDQQLVRALKVCPRNITDIQCAMLDQFRWHVDKLHV